MTNTAETNEKIIQHEAEIKNLNEMVFKMDKKVDRINENIQTLTNELHSYNLGVDKEISDMNIELNEKTFEIDKRVTALESRIETLKWVFGAVVVIITVLQFLLTHLH